MKWYHVRCRAARLRGSIGAFSLEYERLEAESPEDAEAKYREKYETNGPPVEWMEIQGRDPGRPTS